MTAPPKNWYRRGQFLLGPAAFAGSEGWSTHPVGQGIVVAAHPDLPVCAVREETVSLTLLGHLLDPRSPNDGNEAILRRLAKELRRVGDLETFPRLTDQFCGRWVLIAALDSEAMLLHDAAGQRQVHYASEGGLIYCASQPALIARQLGLQPARDASNFRDEAVENMGEYFGYQFWWPGDTTIFSEVKRLLPNHSLDLRSGRVRRFFGTDRLPPRDIEDAASAASEVLTGAFISARKRFPLALGCTAGWDSRVLMAASRAVCKEVFYYTNRRYGWNRRHPDAEVPRRLLSTLGAEHHVVHMPRRMSEVFERAYRANVDSPHDIWGITAEGEALGLPASFVVLTGHVSEVCRCFFWKDGSPADASPAALARCVAEKTALPESRFAVDAFGRWLSECRFGEGLNVMDMFYWEQRAGGWAATRNDELAIAHETIPLFNCRELLLTLLSVDVAYRRAPGYDLYRRLIERLWPEALSEPVNPPKPAASVGDRGVEALAAVARRLVPGPALERVRSALGRGRRVV